MMFDSTSWLVLVLSAGTLAFVLFQIWLHGRADKSSTEGVSDTPKPEGDEDLELVVSTSEEVDSCPLDESTNAEPVVIDGASSSDFELSLDEPDVDDGVDVTVAKPSSKTPSKEAEEADPDDDKDVQRLLALLSPGALLPNSVTGWGTLAGWSMVVLVIMFYIFPRHTCEFIYQYLLVDSLFWMPMAIGIVLEVYAVKLSKQKRRSLAMVYTLAGVALIFFGGKVTRSMNDWQTAMYYQFEQVEEIPGVNPKAVRFTPSAVAYNDVVQTFASSEFTVQQSRFHAIPVHGGTGYVVPVTPDGLLNTFILQNDGFVLYDDNSGLKSEARVKRIRQTFQVGEGMEFLDNIWRRLYLNDPFCIYSGIVYLPLRGEDGKFVAVASRLQYKWRFPWFWVPVWAGVSIVHEDGRIETLSAQEAQDDPRLTGLPIYPRELARKQVEVQIYDKGLISGWYRRPGMIRVPHIPNSEPMPYFTQLADGRSEWVVATEPAGQSYALFRLYYVDSHSGKRTYYECDPDKGVLGPVMAMERVKSLSGYRWSTPGKQDGDFAIMESVYLPKGKQLFWKYTVTTAQGTGVVLTVVVDATTKEIVVHATREEFEAWLEGRKLPVEKGVNDELKELKDSLRRALEKADALEKRISPSKK